jgi:hypothetical protein
MSLTEFIKQEKLIKDFDKVFTMPIFEERKKILASPLSTNYTIVGTAFDYLFRFYMGRNKNVVNKNWVSEKSLNLSEYHEDLKMLIINIIKKAKHAYSKYLKNGFLTDKLLESTLLLAKLDGISRSGGMLPAFFDVNDKDIQDLKNLYSIIPDNVFRVSDLCILNPTFGPASLMVGGADADVIVGDILIDIKTTIDLRFKKDYFTQLIGYYILNRIGKIDGLNKKIEINKLGIYF